MTAGGLITALSLQAADGTDVPLIAGDARKVTKTSGLVGIASREVVIPRAGRDGSRNLTRYRDPEQIVIEGLLIGDDAAGTWAQYDVVGGVLAAAVDADRLLKWTAGPSLTLQRNVRLSSFDGPVEVGPDMIVYQALLRPSDPNAYSQSLSSASAVPLGGGGGGLVMPVMFPFTFIPAASTVAAFTNGGFVPTPPVFVLSGWLQNPIIQLSPGVALVIDGEVAASDTLTIDVDARTVLLNGTDNRRSLLDTVNSTWFELPAGSGTVTLFASNFTSGAGLTVTWRDARS